MFSTTDQTDQNNPLTEQSGEGSTSINTTFSLNGKAEPNNLQAAHDPSQYPSGNPTENAALAAAQAQQYHTLALMLAAKRWLVWDAKKQPFYPNGSARQGKLDSESDQNQFGTYEEACNAVQNSGGRFVGIGFALGHDGRGGRWQGIDLDDIPQNQLSNLANIVPGYVERSPSGNGIHAIGYGRHFPTLGSNGSGVEAYAEGRYFTFTGDTIRDTGLTCLADFVGQQAVPIHGAGRSQEATVKDGGSMHVEPSMVADLRSALLHMRSDDYQLWVRMGLALRELGDAGRGLWMEWSATSEKFDPAKASRKWDSFKASDLGYVSVFHTAQEMGWVNPRSNIAQAKPSAQSSAMHIDIGEPEIVDIEYLQNPWIPKEFVIGCYGRGEAGKSSWAATMAAEISASNSVLWVTSEEAADHIKVRHKCAKGDPKAIGVLNNGGFDVYAHLADKIREAKALFEKPLGLVVLDAIVALVGWGKGENPNDEASVKRLIVHLQGIAASEGVSILLLGHLNKGKSHEHIADAVLGATAWTSSLRLAYMFQKVLDQDFTGFVRSVKQNLGGNFGAFYTTVPVYQMRPNIDGHRPSLCAVSFKEERIYGERDLQRAMADEGDVNTVRASDKQKKVELVVDVALNLLRDREKKTRGDIEAKIHPAELNGRTWVAVDAELEKRGVTIGSGERNRKYYQLQG